MDFNVFRKSTKNLKSFKIMKPVVVYQINRLLEKLKEYFVSISFSQILTTFC